MSSAFGDIVWPPVLEAIDGIRFDFNDGFRLKCPDVSGRWRVVFQDTANGLVHINSVLTGNDKIESDKKYFIRWKLVIQSLTDNKRFEHVFDASGQEVLVSMTVGAMGDTIGWFPYADEFRKKHGCKMVVAMNPKYQELFRKTYPEIEFITAEDVIKRRPYASYRIAIWTGGDISHQPQDFRAIGLHKQSASILGLGDIEVPPKFDLSTPRRIKKPYVCIAAQTTKQCKYWNNATGWLDVVSFLKKSGYRVLCIDQQKVNGHDWCYNYIPYGSEDFTGNLPLQKRIDLLKDADFFVGLSSGLSWLAWGCRVPVVLISGFSEPYTEFYTPYRVINTNVCHSCWNDRNYTYESNNYFWCPRQFTTKRQYECTREISSEMVIEAIKKIPAFQRRVEELGHA